MSDKRTRILRAAHTSFAERGYEKTSVSEIVRRAGIAHGTFYIYFSAKSELLPALVDEMKQTVMQNMSVRIDVAAPLPQLFTTLLETSFESVKGYHDILDVLAPQTLMGGGGVDSAETSLPSSQQIMQPMLAMRQASGEIARDVDLNVAMSLLDSIMMRAAQDILVNDVAIPQAHYVEQTVYFMCRALGVKL